MDALSPHRFAEIVGGSLAAGGALPSDRIHQVSTHSRRIHAGAAFFALAGDRVDGHAYAAEAIERGAAVVVIRQGTTDEALVATGRVVEVDDPLAALQRLAHWWRTQISAEVVAVVGSNGKTTTKDALAHFTDGERSVYASPGSYNSQLGVALAILACPRQCDIAIFELAVSEPGEMDRLEAMVRPDAAVMTNLGTRWRSHFDDAPHQARELLSICQNLDGWIVLGDARPEVTAALPTARGLTPHAVGHSALLPRFSAPQHAGGALTVQATFPSGTSAPIRVETPSEEILADIELALAAASLLGVEPAALLKAADGYRPTSTRMEIWRSPGGTTLIRDVATPDPIAVGSAIRAAKRVADRGARTVVVLGEQLEIVDDASVDALAHVLGAEQVDGVFAMQGRLAGALRDATAALSAPGLASIQLFDSAPELRNALLEDLAPGDVVLVQSAPDTPMGDLAGELVEAMAPTRFYLDLAAIDENVASFRRVVGGSVRIMGVVKALAYGTDSVNVASSLEASGVDFLGVSNADEGVALRRAGISVPILVMLGTARDLDAMARHRLTPSIYSAEMLDAVIASQLPLTAHVEFDTGMHRTGLPPADAPTIFARLRAAEHVHVEGVSTHLASPDDPSEDAFTESQLASFGVALAAAREAGFTDLIRHAAATGGTIRFPQSHFDMVRIGIGLYGVHPSPDTARELDLVTAFGLVSRIVETLDLVEGDRVGYGGTHTVGPGGARVAVVPAGYHDCVPRHFSNVGHVIVAGQACPIVGRVSMDSMSIDISGCPDAQVGSDVLILGRRGDWLVSPELLAEEIRTIAYELMVRVGQRVQRIFTQH